MFKKILIANRGEIAVRVIRACREMGIETAAIYSDADRKALHVRFADEAVRVGAAPPAESYLRIDRVIEAAQACRAEAIHPGYGFLSENADFARACEQAKLNFIGPSAHAMDLMGSKTAARSAVVKAGLPVIPGSQGTLESLSEVTRAAATFGYPVMLKASEGGGGMGLRVVRSEAEMEAAFRAARAEAKNAFGDDSVYVEKYLERPRHIEVQILGDHHGHLIHLGERECSLQRRRQKVMEESPSLFVNEDLRRRMGETAVRIGALAGYRNAGTVEFLVDRERNFYFLEMNTRLQVEHPVTEAVTGIDLVKAQIRIAAGEPLPWRQEDIRHRGHAVECRIYAEDPENNFFPSPGLIQRLRAPAGPGVRDDSGVYEGWSVPLEYDPLLSKLVAVGENRAEAIARMDRALAEYEVEGIKTNIAFFRRLLRHPAVKAGELDTAFIDRALASELSQEAPLTAQQERVAALAVALELTQHGTQPPLRNSPPSRWKSAGLETLLNNRIT